MAATVVIGGTSGLGKEVARHYAGAGHEVILSGRDSARSRSIAEEIGGKATGIALDLTRPKELAGALSGVGSVKYLVLAAIDRDNNTVKDYNIDSAIGLVISKLVGYSEVIHTLSDRLSEDSAIVLFGGQARERPYPGSTTVTTINGGEETSLRQKLNTVVALASRGQTRAAVNMLNAFVLQIHALVSSGSLSPSAGQALIADAAVIAALLQ